MCRVPFKKVTIIFFLVFKNKQFIKKYLLLQEISEQIAKINLKKLVIFYFLKGEVCKKIREKYKKLRKEVERNVYLWRQGRFF